MEIAKHIFRGYDIRGIYGEDLNEEVIDVEEPFELKKHKVNTYQLLLI